jgi:ABC-type phosphate/phosphonate transport system permease subunit
MKRDYVAEKAARKRTTKEAMWFLLVLIIIFVVVIVRIAIRSISNDGLFSSMPGGDDAFEIAKDYIRPTLRFPDAVFADGDFQYAKGADSVYVVKSYFESNGTGTEKVKTNFTVRIKFNGGSHSNAQNWSLITLEEH